MPGLLGHLALLVGLMTRSDMGPHRRDCARYDVLPEELLDLDGLGLSLFRLGALFQSSPCMMEVLRAHVSSRWGNREVVPVTITSLQCVASKWHRWVCMYEASADVEDPTGAYAETAKLGTWASLISMTRDPSWRLPLAVAGVQFLNHRSSYGSEALGASRNIARDLDACTARCEMLRVPRVSLGGPDATMVCETPKRRRTTGTTEDLVIATCPQFVDAAALDMIQNQKVNLTPMVTANCLMF